MKIFLSGILCILFSVILQAQAAFADDTGTPRYFRIPVFYVTDRNRVKSKDPSKIEFGPERQHEGYCPHDPFLGVSWCVIENTAKKPLCPTLQALGWTASTRDGEGPDGIELTAGNTYDDKKKAFYNNLYKGVMDSDDHELYMFAPGYMSTFESGLRSAARLGYFSQRPVLLYSWPSKGKFTEYWSDEATVEWSQDHFDDMLNQIGQLGLRNPPLKARLYAHSMGGRFVLRATPLIKTNKAIEEVSMVCPDVDDGVVKHYASKYFDGSTRIVVRLYESKRDEMLKISQLVHGGYKRFGEDRTPLDSLSPKGTIETLQPSSISDMSEDTKSECAMTRILRRMQTIDFTDLDVGTLGHRIPVEVLASLSEHGCPGEGLTMCVVRRKKAHTAEVTGSLPPPPSSAIASATTAPKSATGSASATPQSAAVGDRYRAEDSADGVIRIERTKRWFTVPVVGTLIKYRPRLRLLMTKDWSLMK